MKVIGVIPARFGSTRFPGKPLKLVNGKPLLQWVVEAARTAKLINEIWLATDDERIADLGHSLKMKTIMTAPELPSGSDRIWEAVKNVAVDVVVNIQGDEPLITGQLLDQLVQPFSTHSQIAMATLGRELKSGDLESPNTAKIVTNVHGDAIYFSRLPIPFTRVDAKQNNGLCLKHIGLYAYRKNFLQQFCSQGPVPLELAEGLEQLRALYLGAAIRVVKVEHESWGVDTPEDVAKVEELLRQRGNIK